MNVPRTNRDLSLHKIHCRVRRPRRTALLNPSETPQCSEGTIHAHSAIYGESQFMSQDNSFRIAAEHSSPLQVFPPQRHNLCRVDGLPRPQARSASYPMHRRYHIVCKANISRTKCISLDKVEYRFCEAKISRPTGTHQRRYYYENSNQMRQAF